MGVFYDRYGKDIYRFMSIMSYQIKTENHQVPIREWIGNQHHARRVQIDLNSASWSVLDGGFDTKVRANNKTDSMRIVLVIEAWIIRTNLGHSWCTCHHQIQMVSTCLISTRNWISKSWTGTWNCSYKWSPEPRFLISKDTNNRASDQEKGWCYPPVVVRWLHMVDQSSDKRLTHLHSLTLYWWNTCKRWYRKQTNRQRPHS